MVEETQTFEKNRTWVMVDLPIRKNAINLKWVFKTKFALDESIQDHNACLVAKECAQQQNINFEETFSHVARSETIRTVLTSAAKLWLPIYQFDVKSTFLKGGL